MASRSSEVNFTKNHTLIYLFFSKTKEQRTIIQQYGDWYTGRWWVGCSIWYSEEEPVRAVAPRSSLFSCGMNCQFPYKRSILCQCLKINWNNICCYHINLIYNVCVFLLLLLFFCVYYCNDMSAWSGQDVSFLLFVWADFYCLCCYYGLPALLSQWLFW